MNLCVCLCVHVHVCVCVHACLQLRGDFFFFYFQNDGLVDGRVKRTHKSARSPGAQQTFPEGLGRKSQTEKLAGWQCQEGEEMNYM